MPRLGFSRRRYDAKRPSLDIRLDRSHWLTNGLVGCWLFNNNKRNLAETHVDLTLKGNDLAIQGAAASFLYEVPTPDGTLLWNVNQGSRGFGCAPSSALQLQPPLTIAWRGFEIVWGSVVVDGPCPIFGLQRQQPSTFYPAYGLARANNSGAKNDVLVWSNDGTNANTRVYTVYNNVLTEGPMVPINLAFVFTTTTRTLYYNGQSQTASATSGTWGSTIAYDLTPWLHMLYKTDDASQLASLAGSAAWIWNRELTVDQIGYLAKYPFEMFAWSPPPLLGRGFGAVQSSTVGSAAILGQL